MHLSLDLKFKRFLIQILHTSWHTQDWKKECKKETSFSSHYSIYKPLSKTLEWKKFLTIGKCAFSKYEKRHIYNPEIYEVCLQKNAN